MAPGNQGPRAVLPVTLTVIEVPNVAPADRVRDATVAQTPVVQDRNLGFDSPINPPEPDSNLGTPTHPVRHWHRRGQPIQLQVESAGESSFIPSQSTEQQDHHKQKESLQGLVEKKSYINLVRDTKSRLTGVFTGRLSLGSSILGGDEA